MGQAQEVARRIGKLMREGDTTNQEALPERWVDLIQYLDEKERRERRDSERPGRRQN
jgi:hypothetical protein